MRGHVLRALLRKEALRIAAHRGTTGMVLLLVVSAVLLSVAGARALEGAFGSAGANRCVIDVWEEGPWVTHLRSHVPSDLRSRVSFRDVRAERGFIRYPTGSVGVQLRPGEGGSSYKIWTWHAPGASESALWCEAWVWRETREFFLTQAAPDAATRARAQQEIDAISSYDDAWALREAHARFRDRIDPTGTKVPRLEVERSPFRRFGTPSPRDAVAMALTLLGLFFVGIFLLPSITAEERERGSLAAVALSPAHPSEIVLAKLAFYFAFALVLAATLGGIASPPALLRPLFWGALAAVALAAVAIGFSIASLAKTQRGASLLALSYLFASGVLLTTGRDGPLEPVTWLLIERHGPELLLAALGGAVRPAHFAQLGFTAALAAIWVAIAGMLYRRFGWR